MKWIASLTLFVALTGGALAAGTDDQYLDILGQILQADTLQQDGHLDTAAIKFRDAEAALEKLHTDHPKYNESMVQYRLDYLAGKVKQLGQYLPAATNAAPAMAASSVTSEQLAGLQEQISALTAANEQLQAKLKEALSVQPAAVAPGELVKAQKENVRLQKELAVLQVALDQQKSAAQTAPPPPKLADELAAVKAKSNKDAMAAKSQIADLTRQVAETKKLLADTSAQVDSLKARPSADAVKDLTSQRDKLVAELAAAKSQSSKEAKAADAQTGDLNRQLAETKKMLADATAEVNSLKSQPSDAAKELASEKDKLVEEMAAVKVQSAKDAKTAKTQIADLNRQLDETKKMLADNTKELEALKSRPSADAVKDLTAEREKLKKDLATISKELADREAHAASSSGQDAAKLKQVEQERDNLKKQVAALTKPAPTAGTGNVAALTAENAGLRAQLAVLETPTVPLTTEELAVLNATPPAAAPAQIPVTSAILTHKVHSVRDLPPGAGVLMTEALRAAEEQHDYVLAEKKLLEVLAQDPDNVYVLVHLGDAQFAEGHLEDCEKNVHHALALDPDDPGALYLQGILRYRQDKLDEAMESLSRSASLNATNSSTQYYLGCVLAAKNLPAKAETALRKALQIDPLYADAHFNLALVYAAEKPPSLALAGWHYQRAVSLGHAKNPDLEKMLAGGAK
jgi:Tfp pilus assembly protein PilF